MLGIPPVRFAPAAIRVWRRNPMCKLHWIICFLAMLAPAGTSQALAQAQTSVMHKPPITGFIDMQTITWHNNDDGTPDFVMGNVEQFPGVFGGIVLNATWWQMQPKRGGPIKTEL